MANYPIFAPTFHGKVARVKELFDDDPSLVTVTLVVSNDE